MSFSKTKWCSASLKSILNVSRRASSDLLFYEEINLFHGKTVDVHHKRRILIFELLRGLVLIMHFFFSINVSIFEKFGDGIQLLDGFKTHISRTVLAECVFFSIFFSSHHHLILVYIFPPNFPGRPPFFSIFYHQIVQGQ